MDTLRSFNLHKRRKSIEEIARWLNPFLRGVYGYYCKIWYGHMYRFWIALNQRLLKWLRWEKGLYMKAGIRYLQVKYKENPGLFYRWKWVHPKDVFVTFVTEQEELPLERRDRVCEGRLSSTVLWEREGETPLRDPTG